MANHGYRTIAIPSTASTRPSSFDIRRSIFEIRHIPFTPGNPISWGESKSPTTIFGEYLSQGDTPIRRFHEGKMPETSEYVCVHRSTEPSSRAQAEGLVAGSPSRGGSGEGVHSDGLSCPLVSQWLIRYCERLFSAKRSQLGSARNLTHQK